MNSFEAYLTDYTIAFFRKNIEVLSDFLQINTLIRKTCGINNFFTSQKEANQLTEEITDRKWIASEPDRREYGDFQTNDTLARLVSRYAFSKQQDFDFILEPTCGKGNFILATLRQSGSIKKIVGIEIYLPYVWETKFKIFTYFLEYKITSIPDIDIVHGNTFDYPYLELAESTKHLKTLIIGNPPWVTNSELGSLDSQNLPTKSNFKKHNGFDAITGKGNFDIGEYISCTIIKCFEKHNGIFSFLIKNSVVKNLIYDQKINNFSIGKSEMLNIDSKREFNVSVNACLFIAQLNSSRSFTCKELDFYTGDYITTFGWYKDKFVYSIDDYDGSSTLDGKSIFTWRSGVKHDCSKIMELEKVNDQYVNGLGEVIKLESNLLYGLLKSSDLKGGKTTSFRKLTIMTQNKIGQETEYIKNNFPLTFTYLDSHREYFNKRKSVIYNDKPDFSIFGVGEYSFTKYKVAISGLYKSTHFTLVGPQDSKPVMLDDTCYFIGFDDLKLAEISHYLLNSDLVQKFLRSIIFSDSKRSINKDTLMRIDFAKAFENCEFSNAKNSIDDLRIEDWENFGLIARSFEVKKLTLF